MNPFDLLGPLPTGTTVLEASAGTGKTYAIVGLATRYVAEGLVDISQLLLVTFSRAATAELRERTRTRFLAVAAALAEPETARVCDDDLIKALAQGDSATVTARQRRLRRALSDFDAGTIATTHSFCQRMLDALGLAGEREPHTRLVESVEELIAEVVDDLYLARYGRGVGAPPITPAEARQVGQAALADRQATLVPTDDPGEAGERAAFAAAVRAEVDRRKRDRGLRDFDDLLELLHDLLADPAHGATAAARIRARYLVVLVDEFQDTDPLQWDILRRTFHGHRPLVLVGDPKQAVYAFRGAEVLSYLAAVEVATAHYELTTNWRTDAGLVDALDHLYGGAALGHADIVVPSVRASHTAPRLVAADGPVPPLRLRCLPRRGSGPLNQSGFPSVGRLRASIADDVAAQMVRLLEQAPQLHTGAPRALQPRDIAVLVRTRSQLDVVRAALDRAGIPSVLAGGTSVFVTAAATQWLWFLQALEQPHRLDRVRLAALTPIVGWTAAQLDAAGADAVAELAARLRELSGLFAHAGFAAVVERISAQTALDARLLAIAGGERELTDLRHLAQLLNRAAVEESLGLSALTRWLAERLDDPVAGTLADRIRRLDSDAAAVQVATVHASKGLEFPVVYVPFAWDTAKNPYPSSLLLHDADQRRVLDVGGPSGAGYAKRKQRSETEESDEELRLCYVALTRAKCHLVAWWAPSSFTAAAPLHRLLMRGPDGAVPTRERVPADPAPFAVPGVSVEHVDPRATVLRPWTPPPRAAGDLAAAVFDRMLDAAWRRTSYSALTAAVHESAGVRSEPEESGVTDEPVDEPFDDGVDGGDTTTVPDGEHSDEAAGGPVSLSSPMNALPYGKEFGTLVHEILETVDTAAADLRAEVTARAAEAVARTASEADPELLAAALLAVLHTPTPFGPLATIAPRDRLAELEFEFPLAGGDAPSATVTLADLAAVLRAQLPADDPLAGYAELLARIDPAPVRGFLTGSIDAVFRLPGPRFVIVDYKTNRLGAGELTAAHYTRDRMAAEMVRAHYPLQALLYSVALHRYLRLRLPGYDPRRHLGGVGYLFVRGMVGPETPHGCGVFDWHPPAALIEALSEVLE